MSTFACCALRNIVHGIMDWFYVYGLLSEYYVLAAIDHLVLHKTLKITVILFDWVDQGGGGVNISSTVPVQA